MDTGQSFFQVFSQEGDNASTAPPPPPAPSEKTGPITKLGSKHTVIMALRGAIE